jgi:ferredoxin
MLPSLDPAWLLLAGHLIHAEDNPLRKKLLYLLARRLEMPFLRFSYRALRGRLRFLTRNRVSRELLRRLAVLPLARYGDTAHPMITADALRLVAAQDTAIAIGPCRCRLAHDGCAHRLETDMVIRTGTGAFTAAFPQDYRVIGKGEAAKLLRAFADEGLWHMVFLHCPDAAGYNEYAICNCCTCGCVPFMLNKFFGQNGFPLVRGEHVAATVAENCRGCGGCLEVCPWQARALRNGKVAVDPELCFGCGLCARFCRNGGVVLNRSRPRPALRSDRQTA